MTKLEWAKFSARIIAWAGVWLLETVGIYERVSNNSFPVYITIILWIIVAATYITGLLDIQQSFNRSKTS